MEGEIAEALSEKNAAPAVARCVTSVRGFPSLTVCWASIAPVAAMRSTRNLAARLVFKRHACILHPLHRHRYRRTRKAGARQRHWRVRSRTDSFGYDDVYLIETGKPGPASRTTPLQVDLQWSP